MPPDLQISKRVDHTRNDGAVYGFLRMAAVLDPAGAAIHEVVRPIPEMLAS